MMRRIAWIAFALLALSTHLAASVPSMINYQGRLMQQNGAPVPDGSYSITFTIYDAETGGNVRWCEPNVSVQVKGGLFAVLLGGNATNLPPNIFDDQDRWFGIRVGSDPEMAPRQKISSVAYATKAASADLALTVPDGSITAPKLGPGLAIPPGAVIMWSGAADQIPQGWALCDGTSGTPDLTGRFVVGVGAAPGVADRGGPYAVGDYGGKESHLLTADEIPDHSHFSYQQTFAFSSPGVYVAVRDNAEIGGFEGPPSGGGNRPHENRPPYYALCFIMKLPY